MKKNVIRPLIQKLNPYVPGEQINLPGLIRLNTNEPPYAPAPEVLARIKDSVDARLRRYPNPTSDEVREKLASIHGCKKENILVGNGSDEVLELAVRVFVEPISPSINDNSASTVQYFDPSYSLYPVLADIAGALKNPVPLLSDFGIPITEQLKSEGKWDFNAALTFVTTPNAPTGRGYTTRELETLCANQNGIILLDEAYANFAEENAMSLALKFPNVLVARTFSKAYALCFQRIGYVVGPENLISSLHKIRGSYNVNGLAQVAASASLDYLNYYQKNFEYIKKTRAKTSEWLSSKGFYVNPSQTNFIFVRPPNILTAENWYKAYHKKNVLVRWWEYPNVKDYLRISIGSEEEMSEFRKRTLDIFKENGILNV